MKQNSKRFRCRAEIFKIVAVGLVNGKPVDQRLIDFVKNQSEQSFVQARDLTAKKQSQIDRFYSTPQWRRLRYDAIKKYGARCQCCKRDNIPLNVDHIKPRKRFPKLAMDINNLQVLCADCNAGKGNRDQTDWR